MSAFLGPIHHWLFNKIKLQDELVRSLVAAFPEKEKDVLKELETSCGVLPEGELADIIDTGNIHGWLQGQVSIVEKRLAKAAKLLASEAGTKETVLSAAKAAGQSQSLPVSTVKEAYQALENTLLDGMPCDRVNALQEEAEGRITWERANDVHSHFWTEEELNPSLFDEIRGAWASGMLENSGFTYENEGMLFSIKGETNA